MKSVNLLANALAKKKAQRAGADEVLLLDDGLVREAASSSFFAVRGGAVITHPLDEHILPGVVRDRVDQPRARRDRSASTNVRSASASCSTSTRPSSPARRMGVMPVAAIDGRAIRRGDITARLQRLFDEDEARQVG